MSEQLFLLQGFQGLVGQLMLIAGICCVLILGTVFLVLFANDRTRARGYEQNNRRKLGHEVPQKKAVPASGVWCRIMELCK